MDYKTREEVVERVEGFEELNQRVPLLGGVRGGFLQI